MGKIPGIYPNITFCKFEVKLIRKEEIKIWRIDGIMSQKKGGCGYSPRKIFKGHTLKITAEWPWSYLISQLSSLTQFIISDGRLFQI